MKLEQNHFLGKTATSFKFEQATISVVKYTEPVSEDWHHHEDFHLSLILKGGNKESRNSKDLQVTPGKILCYEEGEVHRNRHTAFPSTNLNIELNSQFFDTHDLKRNNIALNSDSHFDLLKILHELQINDVYSQESVLNAIQELFTKDDKEKALPEWLGSAETMIQDQWDEFLSPSDIAKTLGIHPVTLSKGFKKFYGETISDRMRKIKLDRAIQFLLNSSKSITEIAHECGFSDQSHLLRTCKSYTGYQPKNLRRI